MSTRIVSYTFDRKSGELLNQEIKAEVYSKPIYIEGVVNTLMKGLEEYIATSNNHKEVGYSL